MSLPVWMQKTRSLTSIVGHFAWARWRAEHLHGTALERFQDQRATATVRYALEHSLFYRALWAGHDPRCWRTLPTLGKPEMMAHFAEFNTLGISRARALEVAHQAEHQRVKLDGLTVGLSSGTGGSRGLFLLSPGEQAAWTGTVLSRVMHQLQAERVALFLRAGSDLYQGVGRGKFVQFRYFSLERDLEPQIHALNAYQPSLLIGPPSLLERLALAQHQGALNIRPQRLIAVAEVLEPHDQTRLEGGFQAPVHQIYQATEGFLAASCACGQLHLQEDIVAVQAEPIEPQILPLDRLGQSGTSWDERHLAEIKACPTRYFAPILTDLWRRIQPIVRYRLGDVLVLEPGPCACGSSWRRVRVLGRTADLFTLEDASGGARTLFPDVLSQVVLASSARIGDYRAEQERPGHLRIYLEHSGVFADLQHGLKNALEQQGFRNVRLEVISGLPETAPKVKRRRMVRL